MYQYTQTYVSYVTGPLGGAKININKRKEKRSSGKTDERLGYTAIRNMFF